MESTLKNKNIIIAGSNGYIGNQFTKYLQNRNVSYVGIDKIESGNKHYRCFNLSNQKKLNELVEDINPDYFFHFATHSALAYKNNFLESFNEDNHALINILNSIKNISTCKLIYFSSSYVYSGQSLSNKVDEETILNPSHNFGLAKSFFEQLIIRNHPQNIIFRLSSVFGSGKYLHPNAIEVISKEAINNKAITIWGQGNRKMQYVYLPDIINYLSSVNKIKPGIYNINGGSYDTVLETAKLIAQFFNVPLTFLSSKQEGETLPQMKNDKIIKEIGKNLFSDFEESLHFYLNNIIES